MAEDDYESRYMAGKGAILHREKTVWKLHWILLFAPVLVLVLSILGMAGVIDDHGHPMSIAVGLGLLALSIPLFLLWVMFISLRVHVTTDEVHVQFGMFGPRIPIDAIDSVSVRDYPALALGGGIKWYDGAWAYTLWGQGTRFVRIEWHDDGGKKKSTILWARNPDELAAIIEKARASKKLRVGVTPQAMEETEEEEERDARMKS